MNSHVFFRLTAMFLILFFLGFGCKKPPSRQNTRFERSQTNVNLGQTAETKTETNIYHKIKRNLDREEAAVPDVLYLRQVMANFGRASSFKASLQFSTVHGPVKGRMEYDRKLGIHGIMQLTEEINTEMYLTEFGLYFRSNTSTWIYLPNDDTGEETGTLRLYFQQATDLRRSDQQKSTISDSAKILKKEQEQKLGCQKFTWTQYNFQMKKETWSMCVKNDLPILIVIPSPIGPSEIQYRDYNLPTEFRLPAVQ